MGADHPCHNIAIPCHNIAIPCHNMLSPCHNKGRRIAVFGPWGRMIGIPLPNILDRWASRTSRCEGATAEKAASFPSDCPSIPPPSKDGLARINFGIVLVGHRYKRRRCCFFSGLTSRRIAASFPHSQLALLASAFVAPSHPYSGNLPEASKKFTTGAWLQACHLARPWAAASLFKPVHS
jgi:hypothetical protein